MLLLKCGADFELPDSNGERAIHYVARYNLINICQWLCQILNNNNSNISATTSPIINTTTSGVTNINNHFSSSTHQPTTLTTSRCLVNVPNKQGHYPLHIAAKSGHIEIVRTLCLAGSIINQRDKDSIIPQICAIAQSHNDIADLLTRLRNERQKDEFIGQLSQVNQQPLSRIKLRIFGHCGAGKSTLIESMKCGYFSSWFRRSKVLSSSAANGSMMMLRAKTANATTTNINNNRTNGTTAVSTAGEIISLSRKFSEISILESPSTGPMFENQTKGIDCQQLYISGIGDLSIWEFSGNPIYYQLYDHFLIDIHCLNAIVFRLSDPVDVQLESINFWLHFITSRQQITEPLLHCGKSSQHSRIILIATHADLVQQQQQKTTSEDGSNFVTTAELKEHLNDILTKVLAQFRYQFDIFEKIFVMDASVAGSAGMKQLKSHLMQAKQSVLLQPDLPHSSRFLDSVLTFLNLFRKVSINFPVLAYHQFKDMIRSQINPLASDDHFKDLINQLIIMGEICFLKSTTTTNYELVVLNPKWLCLDIIGSLLLLKCNPASYQYSYQSHPYHPDIQLSSSNRINGIYSIDEFQELYTDVDALDLLQLLEALSLCTQNDRSGDIEYEFPCFILSGDLDQTLDQFQYRENCIYYGVVYHNRAITLGHLAKLNSSLLQQFNYHQSAILSSIFPRIQANLRYDLRKNSSYDVDDLHNCYQFSYYSSDADQRMMAIFMVDSVADTIDVRFCGPYEMKRELFFFVQEMQQSVERTIAEVAPGLLFRKSYHSPEQLKNHRDPVNQYTSLYSTATLMNALLGNMIKSNTHHSKSSNSATKTSTSQLLKRKVKTDDGLLEERICDILCCGVSNLAEISQPMPGGVMIEPLLANELHSSNLSVAIKQKLCELLDPPESIGRDWCMFGILLGMTDKLPKLDTTTGLKDNNSNGGGSGFSITSATTTFASTSTISQSPTARVIEECVRNVSCTIRILVEKLSELNRFDAVDVILQNGPLLRLFPLSSLPEEGTVYNDESSHTSLGISTMSHTSSSNLSR